MIKRIALDYAARKRPGTCVCVCTASGKILFIAKLWRGKEDVA